MCLWLWLSMAFGAPSAGWRVGRQLVCDCKVTKYCRNNCVPGGLICQSQAGCGVFFAHGFGPLAVMPARRGAYVAAARGLAPQSAFCPANAIPYICIMLFRHPDRLSFLVPAALFRLGPVGLCQWPRSICLPMAPICFATWRQFGLWRVFACTTPCMVRLAVDVASVDENVWFLSMPSLALALGPGSGGLGYVPFCSLKRAVLIGQTCRSARQNGTFGAESSVA